MDHSVAAESDGRALLRRGGLRVTGPRLAVLSVLEQDSHLEAEQVAERVRRRFGRVSLQTVYDVLRALTEAGLLRRIEPAGSAMLYERQVGDNHHHAVCRRCGAVADVACAQAAAPCWEPPPPHRAAAGAPPGRTDAPAAGYLVDEVEVVYWGLCPACQADRPDRTVKGPARAKSP
ncbi:MAG: transcriptional repressor [Propionibacteriaceae bacterium]|nr:transcriptional repressor [Propionibacteriaceae bacterium]